jgi:imidazole glycerol-phosphate synthase subunit HisH
MAAEIRGCLMSQAVTIVDYGMGNLGSVRNALSYLGASVSISGDPAFVASSGILLLPGVGSFRAGMESLRKRGLDHAIREAVLERKSNIMGICLGMQLMGSCSVEDGYNDGLGLIPASVEGFASSEVGSRKVPHIGFNVVTHEVGSRLFDGLPAATDFYFVHSFRMLPSAKLPGWVAKCDYGVEFMAAYEHENVYATQFHPEKSQTSGLWLLRNFLLQ